MDYCYVCGLECGVVLHGFDDGWLCETCLPLEHNKLRTKVAALRARVAELEAEYAKLNHQASEVLSAWEALRRNMDGYDDLVAAVEAALSGGKETD